MGTNIYYMSYAIWHIYMALITCMLYIIYYMYMGIYEMT